jgi:hypothetical protein
MIRRFLATAAVLSSVALPARSQCSTLTTLVAPNNGLSGNSQVLFDLAITKTGGITVDAIDTVPASAAGVAFQIDVYTCPATYVGNDLNPAVWTFRGTGNGVSNGTTVTAFVDLSDFSLPAGSYGVALNATTGGHRYTNGTGTNQVYANADMTLTAGLSHSQWWGGTTNTPRVWNGTIHYDCGAPVPVTYCTAGTSTNGCVPSISASQNPSVSQANPCTISAAGLEGQKTGIVFYGIDNSGFVPSPWSGTSTSWLCVKAPTQRTIAQTSGGISGQCDGSIALDWNAYQAANPAALGNPWSAGDKVYAQAWYRDPPAPKTTNLSDAVELTYVP